MSTFLMAAALIVLASAAAALVRVLGPVDSDGETASAGSAGIVSAKRMMAAQLLGTGVIAALLLAGTATRAPATVDLALVLAMLAPFAVIGLASGGQRSGATRAEESPAAEIATDEQPRAGDASP